MSIKKNNTYYEEDNGKVYYFDNNDVKKDIPASAFSNLDETKYDVSSFEAVSSTFYTTANPSGFITSSVGELDNFYDKATIDSKLADFGGFEVVNLTKGENPVPDVDEPKTTIIYLTKDSESHVTDPYTEWIFTSADASTTAWEVIGETTVDLTDYYKMTETSGANEISAALTKKENKLTAGTNLTFIEVSNEIKSAKITHIKEMDGGEITEDFSFPGYWISYPDPSTKTCTCELKIEFNHQLDYYTNIILTLPDEHSETEQDKTVELKTLSVGDNIFSAPQDQPYLTINVKEIGTDYITFNGLTMPYPFLLLKSLTTSPADAIKIIKTNDNNCVSDSVLNNFAVGIETSAINSGAAFAEGYKTLACGFAAHAEGYESSAVEEAAHAEGSYTLASGRWSHTEGQMTSANADYSHAEGRITLASGMGSHAEGYQTSAFGENSHTEGQNNKANGNYGSHAEGYYTTAQGNYSHSEGNNTQAIGVGSHAEGTNCIAVGTNAHAEGNYTTAIGFASHTEGQYTVVSGSYSHTEGINCSAIGEGTHAEGYYTNASAEFSHAAGFYTITPNSAMSVIGRYNNPTFEQTNSAAFAIGNGTSEQNRSDAFIVNWDGTVSAKKFIEEETPLAITGGDYVSVTEDTSNNKLIIDMNSEMGTMLTVLSGVLSAKPSTGRYILGVDGGTLSWLEVNQ